MAKDAAAAARAQAPPRTVRPASAMAMVMTAAQTSAKTGASKSTTTVRLGIGGDSKGSFQDEARRRGAMGGCEARTQDARVSKDTSAAEDTASRRLARFRRHRSHSGASP